jgi:hypothetical protein
MALFVPSVLIEIGLEQSQSRWYKKSRAGQKSKKKAKTKKVA